MVYKLLEKVGEVVVYLTGATLMLFAFLSVVAIVGLLGGA